MVRAHALVVFGMGASADQTLLRPSSRHHIRMPIGVNWKKGWLILNLLPRIFLGRYQRTLSV